jgi:hypothetical protein
MTLTVQSANSCLGSADASLLPAAVSDATVCACLDSFGTSLHGIIFAGSMARGEATFVWNVDHWEVLGDAEFFVVFQEQQSLPDAEQLDRCRNQAKRLLMEKGVHCYIDLSPVHPSYLKRLQPHILAYELRESGKVVLGDIRLLRLIPQFPASDIFPEDAWRLLSNRIVEYLAVIGDLSDTRAPLSSEAFYRTVKLYLDMSTSFLVFAGAYEPSYRARITRLRELAALHPGMRHPFPIGAFADRVDFCTAFKLRGAITSSAGPATLNRSEASAFWKDAVEYAHRLWRWELSRLTASQDGLSDGELMHAWMRTQSMPKRVRGWIRVFRDSGWPLRSRECLRWVRLALVASPRHWVYSASAEIFFRLPALVGRLDVSETDGLDVGAVCRGLPVYHQPSSVGYQPAWQRAAAAVFSNYQRFVAVTRA